MNPHRLRAYFLLFMVSLIWGVAGPVIKLTLKGIPADIFLLYRFLISSAIALLFFHKQIKFSNMKVFWWATLYSLLNVPVPLLALFIGISKTTLLNVSLITFLGPLLSILAGYIFLKDRITTREKIGIAVAFLGSMVVFIEPILKHTGSFGNLTGNLMVFVYIASSAVAGVIVKKLLRLGANPIGLANYSFIIGFLALIPVVFLKTDLNSVVTTITQMDIRYHLGVLYMALISGTLAFSLLNMGQKSIEVSEAAIFLYLYPIFSGILAIIVFGDELTPVIILSAIITFIGVGIAEVKKSRS